jgi:hypothetical protein
MPMSCVVQKFPASPDRFGGQFLIEKKNLLPNTVDLSLVVLTNFDE